MRHHFSRSVRKYTSWYMHPTTTQLNLRIPRSDLSLRCSHEETLLLWLSKMRQENIWSDWANALADLNLRRTCMSEGIFTDVAAHLFYRVRKPWEKLVTKTYLYNFGPPWTALLYSKTGVLQGYTLFFLFLLKNIDCGNSLEPPHRVGSLVRTTSPRRF